VKDEVGEIRKKLESEPWFVAATPARDHAGFRVEVQVDQALYTQDVLPRISDGIYLVVRKVPRPPAVAVV
jgi:hypothetical protein